MRNPVMPRGFMLLLTAALLAAPGEVRAESWPTLEKYIDSCSLIVKAKTVKRADGSLTCEVIETWKGRYDPKRFVDVTKEGRFFASAGEHGVHVADGQEIVFFFTKKGEDERGRHSRHSTSFPVTDSRVVYASTGEVPQEFTVGAFRQAILLRSSPKGLYPHAISPCGGYRLRIVHIERRKQEGKPDSAMIQWDLEVIDFKEPAKALPWRPDELFFERADPRVVARTPDKEELKPAAHTWIWGTATGRVVLFGLEVPPTTTRLALLKIECELIHVEEFEKRSFPGLGRGKSGLLRCGPFELAAEGEDEGVHVWASGGSDKHEAERRAFSERVPIQALGHRWALAALRLTDAKGRRLYAMGGTGSGGHSIGHYVVTDTWPKTEKIAYPVKLDLRLPKKFHRERLRFRFENLQLKP